MFKNFLKISIRNFWKNRTFSLINIFGLSIGLACCILIFLFIQYELSYDRFNLQAANIFRLTSVADGPNGKTNLAVTPAPWVPLMKKDYPEIKNYVRLLKDDKTILGEKGKEHSYESDVVFCDSTFFDIFSFALLRGNAKDVFDRANTIILTKTTARKYFGNADPVGKTLELNSFGRTLNVEVTGIAADPPSNSHFKFNALVSMSTLGDLSSLWSFHMFQSYVLLNKGTSTVELQNKFKEFEQKYIENNSAADGKQEIKLQPLTDIHLYSNMVGEIGENSDITYIYIFGGIALFILLIACFNFTNLSTARSLSRAKEVGVRKVVGANKKQLIKQFLGEAILMAAVGSILSIIIVVLILPAFNQLAQTNIQINSTGNYSLPVVLIALTLIVGLLSGIYPAMLLSSYKAMSVLKGKLHRNPKGISLRKVLVSLQFIISIVLIASTIIIFQQLQFLKNKKLGFEKNNVVVISLPRTTDSATLISFKASLLSNHNILSAGASSSVPGTNIPVNLVSEHNNDPNKNLSMQMLFVDNDFIKTMQMTMIAGRDFSNDYTTDQTEGFIVNREALKTLGWKNPQEAIDKPLSWVQPNTVLKKGKIIGVVEDFNITPLKSSVQPLVMHVFPNRYQYLYVRYKPSSIANITDIIQKNYKDFFPTQSFEYTFLDDRINSMYASEKKLSQIVGYFAAFAIMIASLGIFGLCLYTIQQKIKEIGIRKVLGASTFNITAVVSKEFVKPILIAIIISIPIGWFATNKWLESFAYRINVSWSVFILAGLLTMIIALMTVGVQAVKAALADPVESLRTE